MQLLHGLFDDLWNLLNVLFSGHFIKIEVTKHLMEIIVYSTDSVLSQIYHITDV